MNKPKTNPLALPAQQLTIGKRTVGTSMTRLLTQDTLSKVAGGGGPYTGTGSPSKPRLSSKR